MRPAVEADRNFIVRGWASEMRHSSWSRHVPSAIYWPSQHELIARLLQSASAMVACDPDDARHLYGCVVWERETPEVVMHWLYVKGDFRGMGLAGALLTAAIGDRRPILCTQASRIFHDAALVDRYGLVPTPYLLLGIAPPPERLPPETETRDAA
jgi:GNAT superfamily N-acetyltransferase